MEKNWYQELKIYVVMLSFSFNEMENILSDILIDNLWIYNDINAYESYEKLRKINLLNNKNLSSYVEYLNYLDTSCACFSSTNLKGEFELLNENLKLTVLYLLNIIRYVTIIKNYSSINEQQEMLEMYFSFDKICYNQLEINNEEIKKYRKERKD